MTIARPVFPDRILFVTRSCTRREYLLRPDPETNNAFTYVLAEAAQRFGMKIILPQMMSNHHHTILHDPHGNHVQFREHMHKMLAKSQNAFRGRWENFWSSEPTCVVELLTVDDLLEKLVYTATNPVKDGLVERVHHWPGPQFVQALLSGKKLKARRPRHFFRKSGSMPAEVELELGLPDFIEDKAQFLARLESRIALFEQAKARERAHTGRLVLGRSSVLRQSWRDSPTTREPRRNLRPKVASKSKWLRIAALQRNKEWEAMYRHARLMWLAGLSVEFPPGTYWLRRFAGVVVAKPPLEPAN